MRTTASRPGGTTFSTCKASLSNSAAIEIKVLNRKRDRLSCRRVHFSGIEFAILDRNRDCHWVIGADGAGGHDEQRREHRQTE